MRDIMRAALMSLDGFDVVVSGDCLRVTIERDVRYVMPQSIIDADDPHAYVIGLFS